MYPLLSAVEYKTPSQQYNSTDLATDILLSYMAGTQTKKREKKRTVKGAQHTQCDSENKHIQKPWSKTSVPKKERIWH